MVNIIEVTDLNNAINAIKLHQKLLALDEATLDFSRSGWSTPSTMILVSQIICDAIKMEKDIKFKGADPHSYAANVNFYESFGYCVEKYEANGSHTYIPIREINLTDWRQQAKEKNLHYGELANQRVAKWASVVSQDIRSDLFELVKYCLREIVRNSLEHGDGEEMWLCGQYYSGLDEVELCIFDRGQGIKSSLTKNQKWMKITNDLNAIRLGILPGTSGKITNNYSDEVQADEGENVWENSGFGLFITSQLARYSGIFVVASGDSYYRIEKGKISHGQFGLSGTLISIRLNVSQLERTSTRIEEIVAKGERLAKRCRYNQENILASAASKTLL